MCPLFSTSFSGDSSNRLCRLPAVRKSNGRALAASSSGSHQDGWRRQRTRCYWLRFGKLLFIWSGSGKGNFQHTEITLSVMKLMGIEKDELTTTAGFLLEFRLQPAPSVRLLNHDPNPIDRHVIYQVREHLFFGNCNDSSKMGWFELFPSISG